jgi:hypothetical protein
MPVNGADQSHQMVQAPPRPIENLGGPIELPEDLKLKLRSLCQLPQYRLIRKSRDSLRSR